MRARQLFLAALGVGLAVAFAPMAVEAAKKTFSFDKKGRAKVAVANSPSVKVPGGVKVTNQPSVSIGNRPEVTVTNRPEVSVANRPEVTIANEPSVRVANQPSQLTAVPPLERTFNLTAEGLDGVVAHPLLEIDGNERLAITELSITVNGDAASASRGRLYTKERTSGATSCSSGSGWNLPKTLRTYAVRSGQTLQLDYSGAPLVVGNGGHVCLGFQQVQWWSGTTMDVGVSGFSFTAG